MQDYITDYIFTNFDLWKEKIHKAYLKDIKIPIIREVCTEEERDNLYHQMLAGTIEYGIPKEGSVPKDDGTQRIVVMFKPKDRIIHSVIGSALFELTPEFIHPRCRSYLKGTSCSMVVEDVVNLSRRIRLSMKSDKKKIIGFKADLSKYFDSVPREYIHRSFDLLELKYGHSATVDYLRNIYNDDRIKKLDKTEAIEYKSLKQGCAVASWLADVILYHIDDKLSKLDGEYQRYCDDILFTGPDYEKALAILKEELEKMQLKLNPKKVEFIDADHWVKFLGFSLKGDSISLSKNAIKEFKRRVDKATFKHKSQRGYKIAMRRLYKELFTGPNGYSWASLHLTTITSEEDINTLNTYMMDAIRACETHHTHIGGLGYVRNRNNGCIQRGKGKNVRANREKMPEIEGYQTLQCFRNLLRTDRPAYEMFVASLI